MRKIPDVSKYETEPFKEQDMSGLRDTLNVLSGRMATGNDAINYVRNFLLEANQTVRELFELAIGRDIRAGVGVGIINEVYKNGSDLQKKVASVYLETFLFYSGFYTPLHYLGNNKLPNVAEIIKLIIRDESVHGTYI